MAKKNFVCFTRKPYSHNYRPPILPTPLYLSVGQLGEGDRMVGDQEVCELCTTLYSQPVHWLYSQLHSVGNYLVLHTSFPSLGACPPQSPSHHLSLYPTVRERVIRHPSVQAPLNFIVSILSLILVTLKLHTN